MDYGFLPRRFPIDGEAETLINGTLRKAGIGLREVRIDDDVTN